MSLQTFAIRACK
ncbi:hypothetical protein TIFTF001_012710 [Ficus carica]|uniref:Uncharacterized protein n=1 Tax=Ficus carica TaxID=3494 RepID=A0AA87ZZH4_FICCA|nr:hypothetical protein TIFTF001_012710 [Ficus carica]